MYLFKEVILRQEKSFKNTYFVKWKSEYTLLGKWEEASGRFSERVDVKTVICDLDLFWLSEVMLTLRLEMQPLSKHKHN